MAGMITKNKQKKMKHINNYSILTESETEQLFPGGYQAYRSAFYDVAYSLGIGLAWFVDYMGAHSQTYNIAFK